VPIVFDPVMVATSGAALADAATIDAFGALMDIATLATPNLPELETLTGTMCDRADTINAAALRLVEDHKGAVLAKGGHSEGKRVVDRLVRADGGFAIFDDPWIDTRHTHGTGCTLSSAIATLLGKGLSLQDAVIEARQFVRAALLAAPGFGSGHGPMGHHAVR
jgi:hydroxymethylpyrimidine/phosphomethylpyrimidine kinase